MDFKDLFPPDYPSITLKEQIELAKSIMKNKGAADSMRKSVELARKVLQLNLYVVSGGNLPDAWENKLDCRQFKKELQEYYRTKYLNSRQVSPKILTIRKLDN
jgi:hypothetical protein